MQSYTYSNGRAGGSTYPSYPPVAPSSPHYLHQHNQRRYSAESSRPPSQAGSSRSPYDHPPRSPLHSLPQHAHDESEDYEERHLGEIAAANQAAQEQRWGPHAALSEAPARFEFQEDQHYPVERHTSMPIMPSYPAAQYDGGFYMEPSGLYEPDLYEPAPQYRPAPSLGGHSLASDHTLGAHSRQSLPVYASPLLHSAASATSPASEPPNMFNVAPAHHLPGVRAPPQDLFGGDARAQTGTRVGDPLPGFPNWSHTWYGGHLSADGHAYTMVPPGSGESGWESETLSHGRQGPPGPGSPYGAFPHGRAGVNDYIKEERIRMLEKEFGPKVSRKGKRGDQDDQDKEDAELEEVPIGGVDGKGRLVLPRRKMRITTRWFQCIISLAAAGCGIGGFILIRPKQKAPPSGTMPSFILYGVSVIATIVSLWLFAFKPCCCSGRGPGGAGPMGTAGASNGMVIPIMAGGGAGKKPSRGMFGKKGKNGLMQQGTTVNLIVDPSLLGKYAADDTDSETDDDETLPGEERRRKKRKGKKRPKMSMLDNIKMQAQWRIARKSLKWDCAWDVVLCLLWGAAAVMALGVGKKCPSGSAEGWCNLYNGAIACAIIAALLGLLAIYCDVVALRASKSPPKTRN